MKVKISGSSGFLGKNLIAFLDSKSFEVESLILRSPNWSSKIEKGTNAIIHLAGKAHDLKNEANSKEYFQINTELTKKLYKVFLHSNASIFIYISSVKAIADKVHGDILFESDNPQPLTAYGKSKLAAENYLQKLTPPEGKQIYILRPCMIHGPHNKGNLNLLYNFVKLGMPWPLGAFENKRSFLSIDNFCYVIDEILKGNLEPGVYNLADSEPLSTNQVIAILGKGLNKKTKNINLPKNIIKAVAKLGDLVGLPLTSERLQKLTENYIVSNKKLITALGKELPITAHEGMLKTAKSFIKNQ